MWAGTGGLGVGGRKKQNQHDIGEGGRPRKGQVLNIRRLARCILHEDWCEPHPRTGAEARGKKR